MERTFDFGTFQIRAWLKGQVGDQPAFDITVITPAGEADMGLVGTTAPLPSEAALFFIDLLQRVLSMGPQRYVQFTMMREQRKPEELREQQQKAKRSFAVAKALGAAALAQAHAYLEEEARSERVEAEAALEKTAEEIKEVGRVGFDLGPVRMVVEWAGTMPDPSGTGEFALFQITSIAPGDITHKANVATDAPFFSGAAEWLLGQMKKVIEIGPERYATEEMTATAEGLKEPEAYAQSLHAIAAILGPAGLAHAEQVLEQAKVEERSDAKEMELDRLEEELKEVRKQIKRVERRKKRSK